MPKDSSAENDKLLEVSEEHLDLLENHNTKALTKIWNRARNIVFRRNRKKLKANIAVSRIYTCVSLDLITRSRLKEYQREPAKRQGLDQLFEIRCSGKCDICPLGVGDLDDKWHCMAEQSGATIKAIGPRSNKNKRK